MKDKELRSFTGSVEVRETPDGQKTITGYAAVFNSLSEDLGGFRERIAPGAFAKSLGETPVVALWSHRTDMVLGNTKSGTLTLEEDERGLLFKLAPSNTTWGKDATESVARGDVSGASFGFRVEKESWTGPDGEQGASGNIRTLEQIDLFEISPVAFPAYPDTAIAVRSLEAFKAASRQPAKPDNTLPRLRASLLRTRLDTFDA